MALGFAQRGPRFSRDWSGKITDNWTDWSGTHAPTHGMSASGASGGTSILGNIFGIGMSPERKVQQALSRSFNLGLGSAAVSSAMIGFQANKAGRGGLVPAMVGQGAAILGMIPVAGFAAAALCLVPGIGPVTAAIVAGLASDYAEYRIGSQLIKHVRFFTDTDKRIRHLEMGGNYRDSEIAQLQRFQAIQDINASMVPGRRYLGQESRLMHR